MTENNSVKSLVGGEVKVLNDMKGSVAASAWREQAERAAESALQRFDDFDPQPMT